MAVKGFSDAASDTSFEYSYFNDISGLIVALWFIPTRGGKADRTYILAGDYNGLIGALAKGLSKFDAKGLLGECDFN